MTSQDKVNEVHEYSFSEALNIVSVSASTLRRRLEKDGSRLGATKLKRGWRIPVTTLEAMGVLDSVKASDTSSDKSVKSHDESSELSSLRDEVNQLKVDNASLRAQLKGLQDLLDEREARLADKDKAMALIEAATPERRHWWQRLFDGDQVKKSAF